jgi:c-di-GMP-binding flagellar brake protein YcgR
MGQERRLHPRALVGLPAEFLPAGATEWDKALLNDLSAGGAGIHIRGQLPVQSELRIRFRLAAEPGGEERQFEILCLAVRSGKLAQPTQQHAFFLGLHFLDLQGEDFDRLRIHVWNLLNP